MVRVFAWVALVVICGATQRARGDESALQLAEQIRAETGVQGGLIVHLGCGDGRLTAALGQPGNVLVHGLDAHQQNVTVARSYIQTLGQYGRISIELHAGAKLPYIDNSVNLIVAQDPGDVLPSEWMRVLVPRGTAYVLSAAGWQKHVKPWPSEIDEWTHYLHGPGNNAVSQDRIIEPPRRYQWLDGPLYSRQHDHMSSVSAVVSAGGRLFQIIDEAPRASILIPPNWKLVARDAFNGIVLWKRDIEVWHPHLWRLKSGPQLLARRLVAIGDQVYTTLGIDAPLSRLDASTGETRQVYAQTGATEEILYSEGVVVVSVAAEGQPLRNDPRRQYASLAEMEQDTTNPLWTVAPRTVMAIAADSGETLWSRETPLVAMSLAADDRHVVFHDGQSIQCLDRRDGTTLWTSQPLPKKEKMRSSGGATLVLYDDVVLYSGQVSVERSAGTTTMCGVSLRDGKTLWQAPHHPCGHLGTPDDILVAGGLAWNGAVAKGTDSGIMTGRDPHTGEIVREFAPDVETHWFHHRCYRAKATEKYLLFSRTGIEFIDHAAEHWTCQHWVRGACHYGVLPCNGLIYAPQHPCACYIEAKLSGFSALAPPLADPHEVGGVSESSRRLIGAAYNETAAVVQTEPGSADWPTFRHDASRSGAVRTAVPTQDLKEVWCTPVGDSLTSPVAAAGRIFVADSDRHAVHALDAVTGQALWTFTAGGRVDSPPTIWRGHVLFGSADGHVYCLEADSGALKWRYRAAPADRRMVAFGRLESVWPVHGSVLVLNDVLYCVAGRSMFLDGGLRLLRIDPLTGEQISETVLDENDPVTGENLQSHIQGLNMPVALPDILSSDGRHVYMRSLPFDLEGNRKYVAYVPVQERQGDDLHLFCPTGFLDDSLWHRTYWGYGRAWASGANGYFLAGRAIPAGRPLVFDDQNVYGFGRLWKYYRWTTPLEFMLFAAKKQPEVVEAGSETKIIKKQGSKVGSRQVPVTRFVSEWSRDIGIQVTSMVLTQDALFVAGCPDVVDEERAVNSLPDRVTQKRLLEQREAFEGERGALLVAVSRVDGGLSATYQLDSLPRFDGLIAASGRLYLTTIDGQVICLSDREGRPLSVSDPTMASARGTE